MELRTLIIGGIAPAILLGSGTVLMKLSLRSGMSLSLYLVIVGCSVLSYGIVASLFNGNKMITPMGTLYAMAMGLAWSTAILCMTYGLSILKLPVSVIAPLTNSNALVAVALGAIVFAEWKDLNFSKVIIGTLLITAGATTVSTALAKNINQKENRKGENPMDQPKDKVAEAYKWANANRPKVNGYPHLAEALRQAGVLRYVVSLPSGQTIYFTKDGNVASQSEVLLTGLSPVPRFNRDAFIAVLRKNQTGDGSFTEFLKGSWDSGVIHYEADLISRKVSYFGAEGESYIEDYPAVEIKNSWRAK